MNHEAADALYAKLERAIDERPTEVGSVASGVELDLARGFNRDWKFHADADSEEFAELLLAVRDGRTQGRRDVNDLLAGKSLPDATSSALIATFGGKGKDTSPARRFSVVIAEHRRVSNFSRKTLQKADRAQSLFIQLIGDKPINLIVAEDVHKFIDKVAAQNVGKAHRPVSRATVQSYLTQVSSPLTFAVDRRWLVSNPAAGHRIKHWVPASNPAETPLKRPFTITELNCVFSYPWFSGCRSARQSHAAGPTLLNDMRYWAPVLALYTGARAAELGGLKLSEVVLSGVPHFVIQPNEYRRTKSGKARVVPMLDALIDLGFVDYLDQVKAAGGDRVFPDWECPREFGGSYDDEQTRWANSKWIRSFNRTVMPLVLPRPNSKALRSAVTFHSFRGAFKSLLFRSGAEKKANAIIGHLESKLDKAYLDEVTPDDLHREFSKATYDGLLLPSRRASKDVDGSTHASCVTLVSFNAPTGPQSV